MKVLFNYAHNRFYQSQKFNAKTGLEIGGFDKAYQYNLKDIDTEFYNKNKHILDQPRGAGYWMWKFYFAKRLLENDDSIPEGSYIFYADSGTHFIGSINSMIEAFDRDKQSIMTFRQLHQGYVLTKRDCFVLMNADEPKYTHTGLRCGTWFLLRKNDDSRKFINECYEYSQDYRIITDSPNEMGLPNYDGFRDHRHDESLISIVSKKWELFPYRNPSQWGYDCDVTFTDNIYGEVGLNRMVEKFGPLPTIPAGQMYYIFGQSLDQYPNFYIDDKSTFPTILEHTRNPN